MLFSTLGIDLFGFEPTTSLFDVFGRDISGFTFAFIVAVVIAPLVEEIFFRGFVLQTLAKKISPFWGVVLTALIFASVHFEFQQQRWRPTPSPKWQYTVGGRILPEFELRTYKDRLDLSCTRRLDRSESEGLPSARYRRRRRKAET